MNHSEDRRHNPVIRAEVERIHEAQKAKMLEAAKQLREIADGMRDLSGYEDCAIYERCFDAVWSAAVRVGDDAEFMKKIGGDTYTGNMAAGRMGAQVEAKGIK